MIKVAALTSGKFVPSTRFRVRQHVEPLRELGIDVNEYVPVINKYAPMPGWLKGITSKCGLPLYALWQGIKLSTRLPGVIGSWRSQITWLERQVLPGYRTLESLLCTPLVFDIDDAIWLARPFGASAVRAIARRSDIIIVGNTYLANWFSNYSQNVRIVPTAIDTTKFRPLETEIRNQNKTFIIGWTGSSSNLQYLEAIEEPLKRFVLDYPDTEILVIADKPPIFKSLPTEKVKYIPWSIDVEAEVVRHMDVGLMPLPDNEWTRGKCSFKMLQYMASGIPVIVSPVGMNEEILAFGKVGLSAKESTEWYEALIYFYSDKKRALKYGQKGRKVVEDYFSQKIVARQLAGIFKELS